MIGSGNVATVLGRKIMASGHRIVQVFSRHEARAITLSKEFNCGYTSSWASLETDADLYIAALTDGALEEMTGRVFMDRKLIVHTAGAVSKDVLKPVSRNYGVLYPLQSLNLEIKLVPEIPLLIDGNTADDLTLIFDFAKSISEKVHVTDDATRTKLHVAAVFVNNFTNHLYALAEEYCQQEHLDFSFLVPLIRETAARLQHSSPRFLQTGPAVRGDYLTIQKHLSMLEEVPALRDLYEAVTKSILDHHQV